MAVRNLTVNVTASYRGRRSFQALRRDSIKSAKDLAMVSSMSLNASKQLEVTLDRMSSRVARFAQVTSVIMSGILVKSFFQAGASFEKSMSGVQAVSRTTGLELNKLAGRAKELGRQTVFTATEAAQGMEKLALAGFSVNEIYTVMPTLLNLAAAGQLEVADAASISADVMRNMGIEAERFAWAADVMAAAASRSNQQIRDIGSAISFVGPVARAAGQDFIELNAAMMLLANRGIRAERAGTALRRIISILIGDLEEGEKGMEGLGMKVLDAEGEFLGLANAMAEAERVGVTTVQVMESMQQRAGPAFLALKLAGTEALQAFKYELENAGGAVKTMAEVRMQNLIGKLTILRSALSGLAIEMFERMSPGLQHSTERMTKFVQSIEGQRRITDMVKGVTAAFKGLIAILASLIGLRIYRSFARIATSITTWETGMANLAITQVRLGQSVQATTKHFNKMAVVGKLAAFGIGWQIGRLIGQLTGLDSTLQELFSRWFESTDDITGRWRASIGVFRQMDQIADKMGRPVGMEFEGLPDPSHLASIKETWERAAAVMDKAGMRLAADDLQKFMTAAGDARKHLADLYRTGVELSQHEVFGPLWQKAWQETKTWVEAIQRTEELIGELKEKGLAEYEALVKQEERIAKIRAKALGEVSDAWIEFGSISKQQITDYTARYDEMWNASKDSFSRMTAFIHTFGEEFLKVDNAVELSGGWPENFREAAATIRRLAQGFVDTEKATESATKAVSKFNSDMEDFGYISQEAAWKFAQHLSEAIKEADSRWGDATIAIEVYAEEIKRIFEGLKEHGREIPEIIAESYNQAAAIVAEREYVDQFVEAVEEMKDAADDFHEHWERRWRGFGRRVTGMYADMISDIILESEDMGEVIIGTLKSIAREGIRMGIMWLVGRTTWGKAAQAQIAQEHAAQLSGSLAAVAANAYSSIAAIPIIGPALAPAAAIAAVAKAKAEALAAAGIGAAMGLSMGLMAKGGLVKKPMLGIIGEAGPEVVLPLAGAGGDETKRLLGTDGKTVQPTYNISVPVTIYGDNWSENGVRDDIIQPIYQRIYDAIAEGSELPLPEGITP